MMVQLLAVVAEFERAVIIDRVIAGMERKAARGEWVAGAQPFGYRIRDSRLVPDETEAPLVPLIFDLYAAKRLGAHAIADRLNQAGHRARSGKPWGHTAVLTVLRNRAYISEIFFRGTWHAAPHTPLVETEVFRQAQVVLTERGEDYSRRVANVSDYLLSGLVTCARWGKHFTGTAATGRSATYRYYTCFSRQRYGTRTCDADRLPADDLDAAVLAALLATYRDSRVIDRAVRAARSQANKGRRQDEAELGALDAEIAKVDATIERYLRAFENGTMPEARAGERVRQLGQQLNELRVARDRSATALASTPLHTPTEDQLAEVRGRVAEALDSGADPERKALLQSLVHEIRVTSRDHIEPFFRVPEPSDATAVRAVYGSVGRIERLLNLLSTPEVRMDIGRLHRHWQQSKRTGAAIGQRCASAQTRPQRQVQRRLDVEEEARVVQDYLAGSTVYDVAERHDIHRKTVSAVLRRHDVPRRRQGLNSDQIKRAIEQYQEGSSTATIGATLGVSDKTVGRALARAGVRLRDAHGHER
jgi:site-specific DNA recombinase